MVFGIIGLSLLFLFLAFIVTESNVGYFLSGFSRLNVSQREMVPVGQYVQFFRLFHIVLAASFCAVGLALLFLIDENAAGLFLGIYPILAYILFLLLARHYFLSGKNWPTTLSILILLGSITLVAILFFKSIEPNEFELQDDRLSIKGSYGFNLAYADIEEVAIVSQLPDIKRKRHGYATGEILKGEFRTTKNDLVLIIADQRFAPFVKVTTKKGRVIYLTSSQYTSSELIEALGASKALDS